MFNELEPREIERIDRILAGIKREWMKSPDQRFFQWVYGLQSVYSAEHEGYGCVQNGEGDVVFDFFYLEDDVLEEVLGDGEL